ncbi:hypothetical protein K435DRAFT_801575 [Dendrothele bispora CBS 962.96]|uniref:Uncharacterized protein n=1 Tax=Dendrothele bispora (strain CBS 962.96) TaxID=1314807 RepID=A0A4S8LNS3_DENBC|nr:hypothetical protein K435DRAFT_801575 [Dendrothele bispora CBS 962.96]
MAIQNNAISCIPASMNAIAHGVFGDKLWSPETWQLDRLQWFLTLVPNPPNHDSPTPSASVVRPDIRNLLNRCEDDAYNDILTSSLEDIDEPAKDDDSGDCTNTEQLSSSGGALNKESGPNRERPMEVDSSSQRPPSVLSSSGKKNIPNVITGTMNNE